MIRKLRRKFIFAAMLSTFLVLFSIIGLVNIFNYQNVVGEADRTLEILSSEKGREIFREEMVPHTGLNEADLPEEAGESMPEQVPDGQEQRGAIDGMSPEFRYQVRFFSVSFESSGETKSIDIERIAAVDETSAEELARKAVSNGNGFGFIGDYRYSVIGDAEKTVFFLDCSRDLSTFRYFLFLSVLISLAGLAAVFVLLLLTSGRIIRPIAESYEKQKRFITDAGHEIKTPITIIDADAEVLEMDVGESEWIQDIRHQTKRLASLTNDLIYLSRMDEGQLNSQKTEFSFSELVEDMVRSFQNLAATKGKAIAPSIVPSMIVCGDEKALGQLVSILLDNAVKYASEAGTISVSLMGTGKNIHLTVSNPSDGLEKGNMNELFERFYRTDRSRNSETGGYGLGLSIAKAVVNAHKGRITAESDGNALTFDVFLPIRLTDH